MNPITKAQVIADPHSCLNKAADDEPIFVLRAQDLLAPELIANWARDYMLLRRREEVTNTHMAKYDAAMEVVRAMSEWKQAKNPD